MPDAPKEEAAPPVTASSASATAHAQKVLDFSFLEIADVSELVEKLDIACPPPPPKGGEGEGGGGEKKGGDALATTGRKRRLNATSVRLSNNRLESVRGLAPALEEFLPAASDKLRWLDLSFNMLSSVKTSFSAFKEINVLYLHANKISKFGEIKPLGELTKLRSLTLHGNPIEDKKHYRTYVVFMIPTLNQLDFSPITRQDRETAKTWAQVFRKKLSGATEEEEY